MISTHRAVWLSLVALGAAATLAGVPATSTAARSDGGTTVTKKLDGPFGLQKAIKHRGLVVAESDTGQITRVFADGSKRSSSMAFRASPGSPRAQRVSSR